MLPLAIGGCIVIFHLLDMTSIAARFRQHVFRTATSTAFADTPVAVVTWKNQLPEDSTWLGAFMREFLLSSRAAEHLGPERLPTKESQLPELGEEVDQHRKRVPPAVGTGPLTAACVDEMHKTT